MDRSVSSEYPELLHYTTLKGLEGILSSKCLWATDAACLNDSSEILYFFDHRLRDLIYENVKSFLFELGQNPNHLEKIMRKGGFEKIIKSQVDQWHSRLKSATLEMNHPFVLSLSAPSDERIRRSGLLSQWRGYGIDGGFALVFETSKLEELLIAEAGAHHYTHLQIGDVYYHGIDPQSQPAKKEVAVYESIAHEGISKIIRGEKVVESERFYDAVTSLSCFYKHWGFYEEREVRAVVIPANDEVAEAGKSYSPPTKEVKTFTRNGQVVPYIELFASAATSDSAFRLPLKNVIVGPHKNGVVHAKLVRDLLARYDHAADVIQSQIPYIGPSAA